MFYPAAKIILKHPSDKTKILLAKRKKFSSNYYEPIGGRLNIDFQNKVSENLEECAIREAKEETGLSVTIEYYLGSYYFFWAIDNIKECSCALFVGHIIDKDINFTSNMDPHEGDLEPAWVTLEQILNKQILISENQVGLESLIISYFNQ